MTERKYSPIFKRARTSEQKKLILDHLLKIWIKEPDIRLGQMLSNKFEGQLFFIEDYDLIGYLMEG